MIDRLCACDCGQPAARGSRYAPGHHQFWSIVNRRFRALERYAWLRGITFTITKRNVAELIADCWQSMNGVAIRQIDRRRGLVPGNLRLGRGRRRRPESDAQVRGRLVKFLRRRAVARDLSLDELERLYRAQRGRCAITGRRLRLGLGTKHPSALTIVAIHPERGFVAPNVKLVIRAVSAIALELGEDYLVEIARAIVEVADRRGTRASPASSAPRA